MTSLNGRSKCITTWAVALCALSTPCLAETAASGGARFDASGFLHSPAQPRTESFQPLDLGEITPRGWLGEQLRRDLQHGLVGVADTLMGDLLSEDIFVTRRRGLIPDALKGTWLQDTQWWPGEAQGYWFDALLRNAHYAQDRESFQKVRSRLDHIVAHQDPDGYLGIYRPEARFSNEIGNGELWTQFRLNWALLTLAELTGESRYRDAVRRSIDCTMRHFGPGKKNPFATELYGGASLGLCYAECVSWMYELTGDAAYRDYAIWLYRAYAECAPYDNDIHPHFLADREQNFIGHSVHSFSHFRTLLNAWKHHGSPELASLVDNFTHKLGKATLPSGTGFGYENMWGWTADATHTPVEYCAITDLHMSSLLALRVSGDSAWADTAEKIFFNAVQGSRLPDGKAVTYCKPDNCSHLLGKLLGRGTDSKGQPVGYGETDGRYKYSPAHLDIAFCCALESTRCYPYYVSNMWMRTERGLASILFGPSRVATRVGGVEVVIVQETRYPFEDEVEYRIESGTPVEFELAIRVPRWLGQLPVSVAGGSVRHEAGFVRVHKRWNQGDRLTISLGAPVVAMATNGPEMYLQRGPLVYALPIPEEAEHIKDWSVPGFHDTHYRAAPGFEFAYAFKGRPETGFGFALKRREAGVNPWVDSPLLLEGTMINPRTGAEVEAKLVPFGSTILRQVTFPAD